MLFADKMLVLARLMTNIIHALLVNMVVGGKTFSDTVEERVYVTPWWTNLERKGDMGSAATQKILSL